MVEPYLPTWRLLVKKPMKIVIPIVKLVGLIASLIAAIPKKKRKKKKEKEDEGRTSKSL